MIRRNGEVVIRMLANVQQVTIGPLIRAIIAPGSVVYTDEYDIYHRLDEWGYEHRPVCHAAGEFARFAFLELLAFFGILLVGFAYLWRRGDLEWVRSVAGQSPPVATGGVTENPNAAA